MLLLLVTGGLSGVGVVVDGCPPRLPISLSEIQRDLDRRRPGQSRLTTPRNEADQVEILSGMFEGQTLGSPIAMLVSTSSRSASHGSGSRTCSILTLCSCNTSM